MRIGIVPDNPLDRIALWSGQVPEPLVIAFWGMGYARCVITAVELEVFDLLAEGERSAGEVAATLGTDPQGTETLLNALNGLGMLRKRKDRYHNDKQTMKWLTTGSPHPMVDAIRFFQDIWDQLGGLEQALRTGEMRRFHEHEMPEGFWERYMRGLATMARPLSRLVARKIPLPKGATRLLDVGGGHGMFSVGMCRRHDALHAEVLDLPEAARIGRQLVEEEGFGFRVSWRAGDMHAVDWGTGYDAVLLFNVLHNATEEEGRSMVRRAREALTPGGTLAVMDSEHRPKSGNHSFIGGFNELFFYLVSGARAWPEATMRAWMEEAGFLRIRSSRLLALPEVILTGHRPPADS